MAFRDQFPVLDTPRVPERGHGRPDSARRASRPRAPSSTPRGPRAACTRTSRGASSSPTSSARATRACSTPRPEDVAITSGTSAGLGAVLAGLDIGPGDEIVTSDAEHPGLIGPLIAARERGATIKAVPFAELANAVTATHDARRRLARELDHGRARPGGAGGGAGPGDPRRRAGRRRRAGGRQGARLRRVRRPRPEVAVRGRRHRDALPGPGVRRAREDGLPDVLLVRGHQPRLRQRLQGEREPLRPAAAARGRRALRRRRSRSSRPRAWTRSSPARPTSRDRFAARLAEAGYTVAPRARTTLVSFEVEDPEAKREQLLERGVAVRNLPGTPYLRASVGAWNDESDLDRLLEALQVNAVCVYCGSSFGAKPAYAEATKQLADRPGRARACASSTAARPPG